MFLEMPIALDQAWFYQINIYGWGRMVSSQKNITSIMFCLKLYHNVDGFHFKPMFLSIKCT